ncbi:hypothetical protein [Stenotrophomonas sp. 364]|uniref:hypothetical protein n=1 Tax=Stenotrophomonas sp. 364 TaxID=2691571 RepID=UPI0013194848|nr:hypothetical protein [Stenotrophomonas sp. 364]QHB70100.1 hypothetical protein GQ674_01580 [Stenotrophomonas sp. 364]
MSTPTSAVTAPAPVPALFTGAKTSTSLRDRLAAQTLADGRRPTDAARPCADDGRPPLAAPPHLADTPVAAHAGLPDERPVNAASGDENEHEAIADGQRPTDAARPCADDGRPPLAAPPHLADTPMAAHVGPPDERPVNAASGDENEHEAMGQALFCALSVLPTPTPPRQSAPLGRVGLVNAATASPDRPHPVPNAVHDTVTERSPVLQAAMRRPSRSTVSWLPSVVAEPMAHRGGADAGLRGSHRVVATVSSIPTPHVHGAEVAHVAPMSALHGQVACAIARAEPMPASVPAAPVTTTAVPVAPVTTTAVPAALDTPTPVPAAPATAKPAAQAATLPPGPAHPGGPAAAAGRPPAPRRFEPADVQPYTASHRAAASTRTTAPAATAQQHNEQTTARTTERALPAAAVDTSTRITVPFTSYGPGHQVTAQWGGGTVGLRLHSSSERSHRAVVVAVEQSGVPGHEGLQVEATRSMDDDTPSPRRQHLLPHEEEA